MGPSGTDYSVCGAAAQDPQSVTLTVAIDFTLTPKSTVTINPGDQVVTVIWPNT
jgi:hypothetical protein